MRYITFIALVTVGDVLLGQVLKLDSLYWIATLSWAFVSMSIATKLEK